MSVTVKEILEVILGLRRKTLLDAPDYLGASQATAWAAGYNTALTDAQVVAATPVSTASQRVNHICTAYESGFGHGLQADAATARNPYERYTEESVAYELGYVAGLEKKEAA